MLDTVSYTHIDVYKRQHEILHAILQQLAFHEECDNENLISGFSTGIYQVLRDNKNLFTF